MSNKCESVVGGGLLELSLSTDAAVVDLSNQAYLLEWKFFSN
jgi:hypothetical protein